MKKYTKTWERVVCDFINHNTARARCDINTFPYRGAGLLTSHLCPLTWAWDFTINLETFQIWFFGGLDSNDRRQAEWPEHNSGLFFWFSFFFCGKTEIMRKQPRSSLLINFPFLSSFPECYQSSHLHNQQVIAFSIANNSLLVSVLYLICKLLPWQHFFFFRGKPNTTDIYRSNLNNVSRGNWYFPSKSGNTLELTKH